MDICGIIKGAIRERNIALLTYYEKEYHSIYFASVMDDYITSNDLETIIFLVENNFQIRRSYIIKAIHNSSFEIVKYLLDKGKYDDRCLKTAFGHSLEMTKLVISKFKNEPWIPRILGACKDIEIIRFLVEERGIKPNILTVSRAIVQQRGDILPYIVENCVDLTKESEDIMIIAVHNYSEENGETILRYICEQGFRYNASLAQSVASSGNLVALKIFHEKGYHIDTTVSSRDPEVDTYLHENHLGVYTDCSLCIKCHTRKLRDLIEIWYLESYTYTHFNQWLPREMMEDVIEVCNNSFYSPIEGQLDNDYMNPEYEITF